MSGQQKLVAYRERLQKWKALCVEHPEDLSHRNLSKPKPQEFGLLTTGELVMAGKIHDDVCDECND